MVVGQSTGAAIHALLVLSSFGLQDALRRSKPNATELQDEALMLVEERDCSVSGDSLCGCSRLLRLGLIRSMDDCSRVVAIDACKAGTCFYEAYAKDAPTELRSAARDCSVNGESLCGCSRLLRLGIIASFDDCTRAAAIEACQAGTCFYDAYAREQKALVEASERDCSMNGESLCGCSRLLRLGIVPSFDECTRAAAIDACKAATCFFDAYAREKKDLEATERDCSVNGDSLCGCSRLIRLGIVPSFDECTMAAAIDACKVGTCFY